MRSTTFRTSALFPEATTHAFRPIAVVSNGSAGNRCRLLPSPCERSSISLLLWTTSDALFWLPEDLVRPPAPAVSGLRNKPVRCDMGGPPRAGGGLEPGLVFPGRLAPLVAGLSTFAERMLEVLEFALSRRTRMSSSSSRFKRLLLGVPLRRGVKFRSWSCANNRESENVVLNHGHSAVLLGLDA